MSEQIVKGGIKHWTSTDYIVVSLVAGAMVVGMLFASTDSNMNALAELVSICFIFYASVFLLYRFVRWFIDDLRKLGTMSWCLAIGVGAVVALALVVFAWQYRAGKAMVLGGVGIPLAIWWFETTIKDAVAAGIRDAQRK